MVLEGQGTNLGVSAPGATLALALIYLKSGDTAVASSFVIPDTQATLQVRATSRSRRRCVLVGM